VATVLLILHIMIAVALIGVVLLQRSEGGALGIGGGGGGFMTGRGAASFLTRVTAGLAAGFFATSLFLSLVGARSDGPRSVLEAPTGTPQQTKPDKPPAEEGPKLSLPDAAPPKSDAPETPKVPQSK
jgi:preprotein translocase subunit SecG